MYYVCMYVCTPIGAPSARRSLIGALIGALCGIDESLVKYARIENVCRPIYRRADSTGSTLYVCMHVCLYVLCMYVCLYYSARRSLIGVLIGALCGIDVSQVKYACIENVCMYSNRRAIQGADLYSAR